MRKQTNTSPGSAGCRVTEATAGVRGQRTVMMTGFRFTLEKCLQFVELIHRGIEMAMNGPQPLSCLSQQMEAAGSHTPMKMARTW